MWRDPIVDELRTIRNTYAKTFDYDLNAIYHALRERETKSDRTFVSLPPKVSDRKRRKTREKSQRVA